MIDFRYHLVSLIAVFLAVALGIIIGTTALNEPILADIENQVSRPRAGQALAGGPHPAAADAAGHRRRVRAGRRPGLVDGTLAGQSVLLVLANEDVAPEIVEQVTALIGEAGGTRERRHHAAARVQRPVRRVEPAELRHRLGPARRASSCPRPTTPASWSAACSPRC